MFKHSQEITVSKVEMAKMQLDAAITAYFENRLIVAITLAGAAEEIFGAMSARIGTQKAVEMIASLPPMRAISENLNDQIKFLNNVRNNLKHASDRLEDDFTVAELDAFVMIVRALGNSQLLGVEDTLVMRAFRSVHASKV